MSAIEEVLYGLIGKLERCELEWDEAEEQLAYLEEDVLGQELRVKGMAERIAKLRKRPEALLVRIAKVERDLRRVPRGHIIPALKLQLEHQELCRLGDQLEE
eukprot:9244681-Alexandrium_andersonii.AAC.1